MTINIEKMRADMASEQKKLEWETRKFIVSIFVASAALLGAGAAIGNYFGSRPLQPLPPPPPQTIIIQQQPYTPPAPPPGPVKP